MRQRLPIYQQTQQKRRRQQARRRVAALAIGVLLSVLAVLLLARSKSDPAMELAVEPLPEAPLSTQVEPDLDLDMDGEYESYGSPADEYDLTPEEMAAMPESMEVEPEFWGPPEPYVVFDGSIQSGDTFRAALESAGIPGALSARVTRTLTGTLDFRRIRPHDKFHLMMSRDGDLLEFEYSRGQTEIYTIEVTDEDKWIPLRRQREYERRLTLVTGKVQSTLSGAIAAAGERADLLMRFVDIFQWEIDFSLVTRAGDEFVILVEKLYDRDQFHSYGRVHHARYTNQGREHVGTYFEAPDGFSGYFNNEGRNLRAAFLRAPLEFRRISSGYTESRFHPVLKRNRPHRAIDYAAPYGTPIWSVADGVVTDAGWMGGAGRAVIIRHANGYETSYSHLSRIAPGMRKGTRVRQKQVIGYLGSSGLATGPHLHYVMKINGRHVNPLRVNLPAGDPVPQKYREQFRAQKREWQQKVADLQAEKADVIPTSAP